MKTTLYTALSAALLLAACGQQDDPTPISAIPGGGEAISFAPPFVSPSMTRAGGDTHAEQARVSPMSVWAHHYPSQYQATEAQHLWQTEFTAEPVIYDEATGQWGYNSPTHFYNPLRTYDFIAVGATGPEATFTATADMRGQLQLSGLTAARNAPQPDTNDEARAADYLVSDRYTTSGNEAPEGGVQFRMRHILSRLRFAVAATEGAPAVWLKRLVFVAPASGHTAEYYMTDYEGPSDNDAWGFSTHEFPCPQSPGSLAALLDLTAETPAGDDQPCYQQWVMYDCTADLSGTNAGTGRMITPGEPLPMDGFDFYLAPTTGGRYLHIEYDIIEGGVRIPFVKTIHLDRERVALKQGYIHNVTVMVGEERILFDVNRVDNWMMSEINGKGN